MLPVETDPSAFYRYLLTFRGTVDGRRHGNDAETVNKTATFVQSRAVEYVHTANIVILGHKSATRLQQQL
jgi:hypothetical protein